MTPLDLAQRTVNLRTRLDAAIAGPWARDETVPRDLLCAHFEVYGPAMARCIVSLPALAASWRSTAAEIRSRGDEQRARAIEICADDLERAIGGGA